MTNALPQYVAGLLFSPDLKMVVLVEKQKPEWQRGLYNAVGGKVEPGEEPLAAMVREFREEAGVDHQAWREFVILHTVTPKPGTVHFFCAADRSAFEARTVETERVEQVGVTGILRSGFPTIPNIPWLVAMALSVLGGKEQAGSFDVWEHRP